MFVNRYALGTGWTGRIDSGAAVLIVGVLHRDRSRDMVAPMDDPGSLSNEPGSGNENNPFRRY